MTGARVMGADAGAAYEGWLSPTLAGGRLPVDMESNGFENGFPEKRCESAAQPAANDASRPAPTIRAVEPGRDVRLQKGMRKVHLLRN